MDKPPLINLNIPDPLKHFAKDHPGWKLAAYGLYVLAKFTWPLALYLLLKH
jgi:hypothetical protein